MGSNTPTVATNADEDLNDSTATATCTASPIPGAGTSTVVIDAIDETSASGSFSLMALCPDDGSTMRVANGEFDIEG